jgi:hypothetical protein
MAAATQSGTIMRESFGSLQLHIIPFTNIDDTNTYASGISRIVGYWANASNDPTQEKEKIDVALSGSTFKFSAGEDTRAGTLYVLSEKTI